MTIVVIDKSYGVVVGFGGEGVGILGGSGGGGGSEGGVGVVGGGAGGGDKVGDVFVAVMEIVGEHTGGGKEDQWARGDRFRGIPDVGVEEGVIGATELLDAEVVVVDETLEGFRAILHRAHFDTAAHAVEGHRDHGVAGFPTDGAVFGIVQNRPNAGLGLDERLVAIVVVLGHEVVDGGVLVEVIGGVGLAFGGRAVSDVVVGIGKVVCGNQFIADVVAVRTAHRSLRCGGREGRWCKRRWNKWRW